jgi:hypothetical protein
MVVSYDDTKRSRVGLKGSLSEKRLLSFGRLLEINKREATEMVNENGGDLVTFAEEVALVLTNQPRHR